MHLLARTNRLLAGLSPGNLLALTTVSIFTVAIIDYLTGYEISVALFYQLPVGVAAWYGGRWLGGLMAVLASVSALCADLASGLEYSHPAILVWNTLVRTGTFLITSALLIALRASLRKQAALAQSDALTGLYNRRAFEQRFQHDVSVAGRRANSAMTIAFLDLDNFKQVNDTLGHAEGDRVLCLIAQILQASVRQADTVARLGGDEFALIFPETDSAAAQELISKLHDALKAQLRAQAPDITCSIGVITLDDMRDATYALVAADQLMYEVKRQGKNAVAYSQVGQFHTHPGTSQLSLT